MANKDLRTCMLCRKKYSFCPVCNPEDKSKPTWYFCWCSDNCHEIDRIASAYEDGRITDIEAKEKLSKLDLSKRIIWRELSEIYCFNYEGAGKENYK